MSEYLNCDCMDLMARYPDKHFDLAIVDPPYGYKWNSSGGQSITEDEALKINSWDKTPDKKYFDDLFRASKNQIIFGANNFLDFLGVCRAPIIWDKKQRSMHFADGEFIWTSFKNGALRIFDYPIAQCDYKRNRNRIHPTQKPVALYKWLLKNYAKPGWLILDTHVGSASSLIACEDMGFDYVGCEFDPDYYRDSCERIKEFRAQPKLILDDKEEILESGLLF